MSNKPSIPPTNDLPGAPSPGKKKKLKHGFYSHNFTPEDIKILEQDFRITLRNWENKLLQVIAPTIASLKNGGLDPEKKKLAEQSILETMYAIKAIDRLRRIKYGK